jgi:hypothetical protein
MEPELNFYGRNKNSDFPNNTQLFQVSGVFCVNCWRERTPAQLLQALNPQHQNLHFQFCVDFQQRLEEDGFAEKLIFKRRGEVSYVW